MSHEITVAVGETIRGKAAERVTFRYDSDRLRDDARLVACMWSAEPTLWFLTATKDGKFAAPHSEGTSPVFDLADPGKLAFAADMKILVKKDAILAVCRDSAKALADHLKRHPNGGVAPKQIPASGEVKKALWAGSATLLIVPEFTTGEKK